MACPQGSWIKRSGNRGFSSGKLIHIVFEVLARIEAAVWADRKETFDLQTSDICSGGAFFRTTQTLPEGTQVKIDLILPLDRMKDLIDHSRANVKVNGTVVRSGSAGMAICFYEDYQIMPLQNSLTFPPATSTHH